MSTEDFEFVDRMRPVRERSETTRLQDVLVRALNSRDWTDIHLAAPEQIYWDEFDSFMFSTSSRGENVLSDPSITKYMETRPNGVSLQRLKKDRLLALRTSDGDVLHSWPIYKCIVFQVEIGDYLYVLSDGEWFRVDRDFRRRIESEVERASRFDGLPEARVDMSEYDYNVHAARALNAICLDRAFVYDDSPDKMEIRDILTPSGALIHVKQRGSSATRSHWFMQGVNSAERILTDERFRREAARIIAGKSNGNPPDWPTERPRDAGRFEVVFAIITRSRRRTPLTLPFFSVISLHKAVTTLDGFGFRVSVARVMAH